jgi:hypothetical protein
METTNITITNIMRRKDRTLPLRAREVSRYADDSRRRYKTKKANLVPKHSGQLVYLCHCSFNACKSGGSFYWGALLFFF